MEKTVKKIYLFLFIICALSISQAQEIIQSFDNPLEDYWVFQNNGAADPDLAYMYLTYNQDEFVEGTGSLEVEYSAHNTESWGGYTEIWHLEPGELVYDFSAYDSISFWYNNVVPASEPDRMHLRFHLYEVSDVEPASATSNGDCEYYYSFHYILDNEPGWNEIVMPLVDGRNNDDLDEWNGKAFNRTGWAGITGNDQLDPAFIKGYAFELNINGSGDGDNVEGVILFDGLALKGPNASAVSQQKAVIQSFDLQKNYPNPFNPTTTIGYTLSQPSAIQLAVYDILGNQVAELVNEQQSAGQYTVNFDGSDLPSGIYVYTLENGNQRLTEKMMLVK